MQLYLITKTCQRSILTQRQETLEILSTVESSIYMSALYEELIKSNKK